MSDPGSLEDGRLPSALQKPTSVAFSQSRQRGTRTVPAPRSCEPLSAETFRQHALKDILPYWYEHALDREHGGYIPQLDRQWRVTDPSRKDIVPTTRLIYNFSQGQLLGGPAWCAEAARLGLDFFLNHFWDKEFGGWYWQVSREGAPREDAKATYGHAFAILALSEFHRAFGSTTRPGSSQADLPAVADEALRMAKSTFDLLEEHVYDPVYGGYRERFRRDWSRPSGPLRGRPAGHPDPVRTQNSQMHIVEALLALFEASGEERYLARAVELCQLMNDKLFDHEHGCLPEFFRDDWSDSPGERGDPVEPGHQMEWAWLLLLVHAHRPEPLFLERAKQLADFALRFGWDEKFGGFVTALTRTGEVVAPNKSAWQQCEAVLATLWLWNQTGDEKYWVAFERAARYCFAHVADRQHGGWFTSLERENRPAEDQKGGPWKADYHPVKMCAEVSRLLASREHSPGT